MKPNNFFSEVQTIYCSSRKRWRRPSGKVPASGPEDQIPKNIRRVLGLLHVKSCVGRSYVLRLVWCGSLEREVPAQVSSSSSDRSQAVQK
ncbi:hypothetical protein AVEN_213961-1 [Araneus ventricosus]|uniref:Uncharacterized protein n=1 Tax=Araneus ventricosus TaxID=182803 RepID=A0A4Y2X8T5_ARAVE|nr:hypothetical protein AVEN_253969-1 [Araneus ventricosus]GBO46001.1 hypothetical protein AVEN_213961-1 [Araneus ventricosus]